MTELVDQIVDMFAKEQEQPRSVHSADEVPLSYEAITTEWLNDVLCRDVAGAAVTDFELGPPDDGSSNRRRIFLTYNAAGDAACLPETIFCKATASLSSRLILGPTGTARGETDFYDKVRPRLDVEAPVAWHARYDDARCAYIVMLKDMADVEFCDHNSVVDRRRAEDMVSLLADLHSSFYENPRLGGSDLPFQTWPDFWANMLHHGPYFEPACDAGFAAATKVMPPEIAARRADVNRLTRQSAKVHRMLPRTLIHCDVHLRNWYVTPAGRMGLTDWQIMTIGHWSRDFIYAMVTSLTIDDRRAWLDDLLRLYLARMASRGVEPIDFETALRLCRQQLFSALAFWTVTLRPAEEMPDMQPEDASLLFIERIAQAMHDLDAFGSFDRS